MKPGAWHQFGDRSQKLALEQLQCGAGAGVVISPRDLAFVRAQEYAPQYAALGAEILVDQQFYVPNAVVGKLDTYPIAPYRQTASQLNQISDTNLAELAVQLRAINQELGASAVLAPGLVYEAGRPDIIDLNARLFAAARRVSQDLSLPCYSTVVLGQSAISADSTTEAALSAATALQADGWYFAFEFNSGRIPDSHSSVLRYLKTGLSLACTGKPVLHAYAGPLAPLALACGAAGVGIGHSQNLWQFTRSRWEPAEPSGGGGDAPPRYFSKGLWGTIIYEDEFALLSQALRERVLTSTQFSAPVGANPPFLPWDRWSANKHLVNVLCKAVDELQAETDVERRLDAAVDLLTSAVRLHSDIGNTGVHLGDETGSYQVPWRAALLSLKAGQAEDFELLRLMQ